MRFIICKQRDVAEDLRLGHAQHLTGLLLPDGHALDAAAVDLGEVAGVVDDEHHRRRGEAPLREGPGVVREDVAGYVEDDEQLQHQRRAADDPDHEAAEERDGPKAEQQPAPGLASPGPVPGHVGCQHGIVAALDGLPVLEGPGDGLALREVFPPQEAQRRPAAHGAEADYEPQRYGAYERHDKELERLHKALVERAYDGLEHLPGTTPIRAESRGPSSPLLLAYFMLVRYSGLTPGG